MGIRTTVLTALMLIGCGDDASSADSGVDAGGMLDAAADASTVEDGGETADGAPPDTGPPPVCSEHCGGDPTGAWVGIDTCYHENAFLRSCPTGEVLDERHEIAHTMVFAADGTWTWTIESNQRFLDYIIPAACIDRGTAQCNEIGTGGISTGVTSCTGDRTVECTCSFQTIAITMPITQTGTWTMVGDQAEVTLDSETALFDICQRDDRLYLQVANVPIGRSTTQYMMQRQP